MPFKKAVKKPSTVVVETKKMTAECCATSGKMCHKMGHLLVPVLLIVNTILLISLMFTIARNEADKVGGSDNYKMVKEIYKSDNFKAQQKQQIEQALQSFSAPAAQANVAPQEQVQLPAAK